MCDLLPSTSSERTAVPAAPSIFNAPKPSTPPAPDPAQGPYNLPAYLHCSTRTLKPWRNPQPSARRWRPTRAAMPLTSPLACKTLASRRVQTNQGEYARWKTMRRHNSGASGATLTAFAVKAADAEVLEHRTLTEESHLASHMCVGLIANRSNVCTSCNVKRSAQCQRSSACSTLLVPPASTRCLKSRENLFGSPWNSM